MVEGNRAALRDELSPHYLAAQDVIAAWVKDYNERRLHAGLRYTEPAEYFLGDPKRRMAEGGQTRTRPFVPPSN